MNRLIKTLALCLVLGAALIGLSRLIRADVPQVPSNAWAPTADMAQPSAGAASTLVYGGFVLVTGGLGASGLASGSVERYSPDGELFLDTPPMMMARANHTSTLLADGRVLVAGGMVANGAPLSS